MPDRQEAPPLEPRNPLCGICGNEVEGDGTSFWCTDCDVTWAGENVGGDTGEWTSPSAAQCESVDGRYLPGGTWSRDIRPGLGRGDRTRRQCILAAGHPASRIHPHTWIDPKGIDNRHCWTDDQAATPEQLQVVIA